MYVTIVLILNLSPAIVVIVLLVHVTAVLNIRIVAMISIDTRLIFLIKNIEKTLLILEPVSICHMKNAKLWLILSFRFMKAGQSPYHIVTNHPELNIFEKTLYNYIENGIFREFGLLDIDLESKQKEK